MYARCDIIERVTTPRGRHGTGSTSVVRYWHVFDASWYWDSSVEPGRWVFGQTAAYRYSDTTTGPVSQQDITRAERNHAAQVEIAEYLRTGIPQYAREAA